MKIAREYHGSWSSWADVVGSFGGGCPKTEPHRVFAAYDYEDYSGSAVVLVYVGRGFKIVEGGHCSCYGLEGQWEPTVHGRRDINKMLEATYGPLHDHRDAIKKWLKNT